VSEIEHIAITVGLFLLGLVLIIFGGDKFVDAAVSIAKRMGVSEIIIGATIVSLGTTLPEVLVSTTAGLQGSADIATGNAFGSIICNTAFIAGLTQLIRPTTHVDAKSIRWRVAFFFGTGILMLAFGLGMRYFGLLAGITLLLLFAVYAVLTVKIKGEESGEEENADEDSHKLIFHIGILIVTAAMLYVGARLLVNKGIILAQLAGVPERVIAVTFIALGTSLPELVTAISSLTKGHASVSVGNIIGANLLNFLLVIGIPSTLCGVTPSAASVNLDLPLALLVMAVLTVPMMVKKRGYRLQGGILVAGYFAYCISQF